VVSERYLTGTMVTVDSRTDVPEAVDEFIDVFDEPVTTASRFYTLYYLSEVKGIDIVDFDLFKLKNTMADAFLNYSLYACTRELSRKNTKLMIAGIELRDLGRRKFGQMTNEIYRDTVRPRIDDNIPPGDLIQEIEDALNDLIFNSQVGGEPGLAFELLMDTTINVARGARQDEIANTMEIMEDKYDAMSDPVAYLNACKKIFEVNYNNMPSTTWGEIVGGDRGWEVNYAGEAWGSVAETALRFDELSEIGYIDLMFSVEHNNGNFLNKIPRVAEDEKTKLQRYFKEVFSASGNFQSTTLYKTILPAVLDAAKGENIKPLFKMAKPDEKRLRTDRRISEDLFPRERHLGIGDEFGEKPDDTGGEIMG
jgi:hypothetical protein